MFGYEPTRLREEIEGAGRCRLFVTRAIVERNRSRPCGELNPKVEGRRGIWIGRLVSEAQAALDERVLARYGKLTEAEIKTVVIEDKWLASLRAEIDSEVQRLTQHLAGRVKELEERYSQPLPALAKELTTLAARVESHLERMRISCA
jgi:hypothetical protein